MQTADAPQDFDTAKLAVLRLLESNPSLTQRGLAQALGLSLGKTHYLLHALLDKGLVKIGNFRRSDRKLAYAYLVTPSGLREKLHLTRSFLARKEAEFDRIRAVIADLRAELDRNI
jgi:EPS-associated MarR family transcriptional regulator